MFLLGQAVIILTSWIVQAKYMVRLVAGSLSYLMQSKLLIFNLVGGLIVWAVHKLPTSLTIIMICFSFITIGLYHFNPKITTSNQYSSWEVDLCLSTCFILYWYVDIITQIISLSLEYVFFFFFFFQSKTQHRRLLCSAHNKTSLSYRQGVMLY